MRATPWQLITRSAFAGRSRCRRHLCENARPHHTTPTDSAQHKDEHQGRRIEPRSEEFYDHYLKQIKIGTRPAQRPWLDLLDTRFYAENLAKSPALQKDPLRAFGMSGVSADFAERWMEGYISTAHSGGHTKEEIQRRFIADKPGQKALLWLTKQYDNVDIALFPKLLRAIVHSLVAEKCEHVIWHWSSLDQDSAAVADVAKRERQDWKRGLLRNFVEAAAFWSEDGLNAALRVFFSTWYGEPNSHLSSKQGPAGIYIHKQLVLHSATEDVDEAMYERFGAWLPHFLRYDKDDLCFNLARHKMAHPKRPDATAAYWFVKMNHNAADRSLFLQDLFDPKDSRGASTLFWFLIRTAQTLHRKQGLTPEAREVLDVGASVLPGNFMQRRVNAYQTLTAPIPLRFSTETLQSFDDQGYLMRSKRAQMIHRKLRKT